MDHPGRIGLHDGAAGRISAQSDAEVLIPFRQFVVVDGDVDDLRGIARPQTHAA